MKLKKIPEEKTEHEKRVQIGKRSRRKGSNYERTIAKKLKQKLGVDFVRTPQSGGFAKKSVKADVFRGDIVPADDSVECALHFECKDVKTWSLAKWMEQAEADCPKNKIPVVVFHKFNTSKDYIALPFEEFLSLVPPENIVKIEVSEE